MDLIFAPRLLRPEFGYFAERGRYEFVDVITRAIDGASTWGELRQLMPPEEFESLPLWAANGGEYVYADGLTPEECREFTIAAADSFDPERMPGYGDGDYPPFLEPEQDRFLPRDFCERYGERADSMVSGSWWEFPVDRFEEMRTELQSLGFSVASADERA